MSVPVEFNTRLDVMNRALQRVGADFIVTETDDTKGADNVTFVYDKLRVAEMRRARWTFSMRRVILRPYQPPTPANASANVAATPGTVKVVPAAWDATKNYIPASLVSYNTKWYVSRTNNSGSEPDTNPTDWSQYFGPVTVSPYDTSGTTQYYPGELVYTLSGVTPTVFMSLALSSDVPTTIPAWNATTYYSINDTVTGSDTSIYQSKVSFNFDIDPTTDAGVHWEAVPGTEPESLAGQNWMKLNATVSPIRFVYPVGAGPVTDPTTYNVFFKPVGFLREAPEDPKAGNISFLGGPVNNTYDDWIFSSEFILSRDFDPISLRYAADVADVTQMDPMFCEALACRIALELCEPLTQSAAKLQSIGALYKEFMGEARAVNSIEQGSIMIPEDDYVATRR